MMQNYDHQKSRWDRKSHQATEYDADEAWKQTTKGAVNQDAFIWMF